MTCPPTERITFIGEEEEEEKEEEEEWVW